MKECADLLGINENTLRRMMKKGLAPPCYPVGSGTKNRSWRFNREALARWQLEQSETWKKILKDD